MLTEMQTEKNSEIQENGKETIAYLKKWLQVIAHAHSKLGILAFDESFTPEQTKILQNWRTGQLTSLQLVKGAVALLDGGATFTDHIKHGIWPGGEKLTDEQIKQRNESYKGENRERTKKILSELILLRAQAERKLNAIHPELTGRSFTGVEVELISPNGELNANDSALAKLDYVGASLHESTWLLANEGERPTAEQIIHAYENLAQNPTVDVINHLFTFLPRTEFLKIKNNLSLLDPFLKCMKENGKALEIDMQNLIQTEELRIEPYQKAQRYELGEAIIALAQYAKEKFGFTNFILGMDVHTIEDYGRNTMQTGEKDQTGKPIYSEEDRLSEQTKQDFAQLNALQYPVHSKEEAEAFEQKMEKVLKKVFTTENGELSVDAIALAKPLVNAIQRLERAGITPEDIINSDLERFQKWIKERKTEKILRKDPIDL